MAEALEALYPGVKFGAGPAIENGFYYDVDLGGRPFGDDDLLALENKMKELAKKDSAYVRSDVSKAEALKYFTEKGDEYKLELINDLQDGTITFYKQGNFTDLCRGPHIPNTGFLKLLNCSTWQAPIGGIIKTTKCLPVFTGSPSPRRVNSMSI